MRVAPIEINWNEGLPIFAAEGFLKTVGDQYGWLAARDTIGNMRCLLPYTMVRKGAWRVARFRIQPIAVGAELSISEEREFLDEAMRFLRSKSMDVVVPAANTALFRTYPHGAIAAPYGTYVVKLDRSEDELWRDVRRDFKHRIRQARSNGVQILAGIEHLGAAYALGKDLMRRVSPHFKSSTAFRTLILSFGNSVMVFVAVLREQVQGFLVMPFSNCAAYTLYSGRSMGAADGAMHLLRWEALRYFHGIGVKRFENVGVRIDPLPGSKQEGLSRFKAGLGGTLERGYVWKYALRRVPYLLYCLAIRVLHGGDIVDQERRRLGVGRVCGGGRE